MSSIIDNLSDSLYSEKEKKDIVDKAWFLGGINEMGKYANNYM